MTSELLGGRTESYRFELLDTEDRILGPLDGVLGGKVDLSTSATVRGSGSLDVVLPRDANLDLLSHRVRVSYEWDGGVVPLITALPSVPAEDFGGTSKRLTIALKDKLSILDGDAFGYSYAIPAGANLVAAVHAILLSAGQTALIEASDATSGGRTWDPNESKLRIINDLLDAANYSSLFADGLGRFRALPYVEPHARPLMWHFEDTPGRGSYLPEFTRNFDPYSVVNRVVCVGKTEGDVEADHAEARDYDSPYGYVARGFWKSQVDTDVDGDLQAQADRRLVENRNVYEMLEVTHPYLGFGIDMHVGRVALTNGGRTWAAVCQRQEWTLTPGALIRSNLRVVV